MVSNSAQLDRRTKQHTQFGVSASNGSRDMARTKSWRKKKRKKEKKNESEQTYIASPTGIANYLLKTLLYLSKSPSTTRGKTNKIKRAVDCIL